ncbi:MAG: Crp/Fnr family transcriptional regulator [Pseudomonadota bacterium]
MKPLSVQPEQLLLQSGQVSRSIFFINSGLVRLYYGDEAGRERNKAFYGAGDVTGPVSAIMADVAASFSIQALEPVQCLQADLVTLLEIAPHHPEISHLVISLLAEAFTRNEQRERLLLTCNAEQRYRWLLSEQPEFVGRIPQYHIASYLGVDAVSLSRIKRKIEQQQDSGSRNTDLP